MKALYFEAPGNVAIRPLDLPEPGSDEVVVHGLASAVSQGTELLLFKGDGPEPFDPSLGVTGYPTRYGYAWVGRLEGEQVFGLLPHGDAHVVKRGALRIIPSEVPAARATLAANLETAVTCVWDAEVELGARVVVLGGGVVGLLTAWLLSRNADVTLVERSPLRCEAAARLGVRVGEARDADVVIEATGEPRMLDVAIAHASARVVVASFYGTRRHAVDLGAAFHRKRLALIASQVSAIPPRLAPRWDYARRFELVVSLLRDARLDALITRVPFDDAPALYRRLTTQEDAPPCHVFEYA